MSSMEPDIQGFLKRIVWSVTLVLVYMMTIITGGLYANWFFFYDKPTAGNYIFYGWILISTAGVLFLLVKWWKRKFPHG